MIANQRRGRHKYEENVIHDADVAHYCCRTEDTRASAAAPLFGGTMVAPLLMQVWALHPIVDQAAVAVDNSESGQRTSGSAHANKG